MGAAFTQPALRVTEGKWGSARRTLPHLTQLTQRNEWFRDWLNATTGCFPGATLRAKASDRTPDRDHCPCRNRS